MRDSRTPSIGGLTTSLVAAAVVLTVVNVSGALDASRAPRTAPSLEVPMWREVDVGGHVVGDSTSRVRVIVFSDYQCAACQALHAMLEGMASDITARISMRWRHFPLASHAHAHAAAAAAVCAAKYGAFPEVHAALFRVPYGVSVPRWVAIAATSGVRDTGRFAACLEADETKRALEADEIDGRRLGLHGTPTILVGSALYGGLPADLEAILRDALKAKSRRTTVRLGERRPDRVNLAMTAIR